MRKIAIYGKGGIGKSTVTQNIAAAMSEKGYKVMVVGCDPKSDSTRLLLGGLAQKTVLETVRSEGPAVDLGKIIQTGYNGIRCVESGGPEPGIGCAGRGIISAINLLEEQDVFSGDIDIILYDVLGDVVCGGFAMPIREGKANEVYIVVSGEMMALYAANNIIKCVERFAGFGNTRLGGIICNSRMVDMEQEIVSSFCAAIGSKMIGFIPRNNIVQQAEKNRKTVLDFASDHAQSEIYRDLAESIIGITGLDSPHSISADELEELVAFDYSLSSGE